MLEWLPGSLKTTGTWYNGYENCRKFEMYLLLIPHFLGDSETHQKISGVEWSAQCVPVAIGGSVSQKGKVKSASASAKRPNVAIHEHVHLRKPLTTPVNYVSHMCSMDTQLDAVDAP
jgi:hypothetical protein